MNNPIKLLPTDLIAVEVPKNAAEIETLDIPFGETHLCGKLNNEVISFYSDNDDFEILGEVTEDEISFDVENVIQKDDETGSYPYFENREGKNAICFNKDQSFRSLLQASGLNWVNEIEKPNGEDYYYDSRVSFDEQETLWDGQSYNEDLAKWQEAESKLIKGKLIILKQIK